MKKNKLKKTRTNAEVELIIVRSQWMHWEITSFFKMFKTAVFLQFSALKPNWKLKCIVRSGTEGAKMVAITSSLSRYLLDHNWSHLDIFLLFAVQAKNDCYWASKVQGLVSTVQLFRVFGAILLKEEGAGNMFPL